LKNKKTNTMEKIKSGIIGFIGYLLSPLSFWNDLYINLLLAYTMTLPIGFIQKNLFFHAIIISYWITNIAGFVLMH